MIKILTDDVELLKEACESLAYDLEQYANPSQFAISDEQVANSLRCKGLEVEVKQYDRENNLYCI